MVVDISKDRLLKRDFQIRFRRRNIVSVILIYISLVMIQSLSQFVLGLISLSQLVSSIVIFILLTSFFVTLAGLKIKITSVLKAILPLIFLAFAIYHVKLKSQHEVPLRDVGLDNGSSIGGSELFEKQ